ncbi:MAG: molecular chaperone DnaJ [Pelagibacteraceae bacterium]|nr:molecular chaperone DnaJ [Pelagibacteraceae bacterium]|tara:strand:+ start:20316 stop:20900 length:585 start_codon:yes stop_codon:yes gene_type:complete
MNKSKLEIQKNNLSWEKKIQRICDKSNCKNKGEFKAPKSRIRLNEYFLFCLKHVKEYNKSWDFYKGLTTDEIEHAMRQDTVWDRPSWPLKGNPDKIISQIDEIIKEDFSIYSNEKDTGKFFKNKLVDETLTKDQHKALEILSLNLPLTMEKIKKKYKKLVKIFHPDVNGNNKDAENKFKEINESYKILLKKFVK